MDTRSLFNHFTTRKPGGWDRCPVINIRSLTFGGLDALKEKPRLFVGPEVGTFDEVFTPDKEGSHDLEFILIRELDDSDISEHNVEAYYVNTEGYEYARYVARLSHEVMRELKIEGRY